MAAPDAPKARLSVLQKHKASLSAAMRFAGRAALEARKQFEGDAILLTADTREGLDYASTSRSGAPRDGSKGIAARELLQELYLIRRDRTFSEAIKFLLYGLVFCFVTYGIANPPGAFQQNDALFDLFLDEEFPDVVYKKNFFEVMTMEEMWTWLQKPMLNGAYPDGYYNGESTPEALQNDIFQVMRRLGGVQLRQFRVTDDSCAGGSQVGPAYGSSDGKCFGFFNLGVTDDRSPMVRGNVTYKWSDGHSNLDGLFGYGPTYGTGGYVVMLSNNRTVAEDQLQYMHDTLWTDRGTRALAVTFNVWNAQTKFLTVVRILFEIFPSGHFVKSYKFFSTKPVLYETSTDAFRALGEIILALGCVYYLWKELKTFLILKGNCLRYLRRLNNLYELLLQVIMISALMYYFFFVISPVRQGFDSRTSEYTDYFAMAEDYIFIFTLAGFVGLLQVLKLFRYFGIAKRMMSLWFTLQKAGPDLVAFGIGFIVLIMGFAFMATMLFGGNIADFHNFSSSFSTLIRYPMGGDVNYNELSMVRPLVTSWFFLLFLTLILLVCFNILVAIVVLFFEEVAHELRSSDPWKRGLPSPDTRLYTKLSAAWNKRMRLLGCRRGPDPEGGQRAVEDMLARAIIEYDSRCWSVNAIDTLEYVDRIFRQRGKQNNVFIGRKELLTLVSPLDPSAMRSRRARCRRCMLAGMVSVEAGCTAVGDILCCTSPYATTPQSTPPATAPNAAGRTRSGRRVSVINRQTRSLTGASEQGDAEAVVNELLRAYIACKDVVLMGKVAMNDDRMQTMTTVGEGVVVRNAGYIGASAAEDAKSSAIEFRDALLKEGTMRPLPLISVPEKAGAATVGNGLAAALSTLAAERLHRFIVCRISSRQSYAVRQLEIDTREMANPYITVRRADGKTTHRFPLERIHQLEASRVDPNRLIMVVVGADEVPGKTAPPPGTVTPFDETFGSTEKTLSFRFLPSVDDEAISEREVFIERLLVARIVASRKQDKDASAAPGLVVQGAAQALVAGIVSTLVVRRDKAKASYTDGRTSPPVIGVQNPMGLIPGSAAKDPESKEVELVKQKLEES